jgi:hypothetical protein
MITFIISGMFPELNCRLRALLQTSKTLFTAVHPDWSTLLQLDITNRANPYTGTAAYTPLINIETRVHETPILLKPLNTLSMIPSHL